jgi:biopolymer transport protein ExbD
MQSNNNVSDDEGEGAFADINVTPFIDVMLVLLIIFMVTAPLMMGGVTIRLPKTEGTPMKQLDNPLIVSLDIENRVYVDKTMIPEENIHTVFKDLAKSSSTHEVYVKGDGDLKYEKITDLMGELGKAGFSRVTLVTDVQKGAPKANPERDKFAGTATPSPSTDSASLEDRSVIQ